MAFSVKDWRNATTHEGGGDETTPLSAAAIEDLETRLSDYTDDSSITVGVGRLRYDEFWDQVHIDDAQAWFYRNEVKLNIRAEYFDPPPGNTFSISNATNTNPIVITTTTRHNYATGHRVVISGVGGNTAANGYFIVTRLSATTFELTYKGNTANQGEPGPAGNGAYTSGGTVNATDTITAPIRSWAKVRGAGLMGQGRMGIHTTMYDDENVNQINVTGASNTSPIEITTASAHGYSTDDQITVANVGGNTAANNVWFITVTGGSSFTLQGSTGNGAYTSGGFVTNRGFFYGAYFNVTPLVSREGIPEGHPGFHGDDVAGIGVFNGAADGIRCGDAIFVGGSGDWYSILSSMADTYVGVTINGDVEYRAFTSVSATIASGIAIETGSGQDAKIGGKTLSTEGIGVGNSASATSLGSLSKKMEVFDASGNSIGFVPIYTTIT